MEIKNNLNDQEIIEMNNKCWGSQVKALSIKGVDYSFFIHTNKK
jgi:hypothetical protein